MNTLPNTIMIGLIFINDLEAHESLNEGIVAIESKGEHFHNLLMHIIQQIVLLQVLLDTLLLVLFQLTNYFLCCGFTLVVIGDVLIEFC